jgi:hypothetical protein
MFFATHSEQGGKCITTRMRTEPVKSVPNRLLPSNHHKKAKAFTKNQKDSTSSS